LAPEDDRGQAGNAPRKSEELYRLLAENSTEVISRHTPEGVYTYVSSACRSLLGYEPEELVGRSAHELFHPEDLEQLSGTHLQTISKGIDDADADTTAGYRLP
jgi:PAS domain S-box-containing protein